MILLVFVAILLLLFPLFFGGNYTAELMLSFLPYIVAITGICVATSFVFFKKKMKPGYRFPAYRYFRGVSFLVFCILFFIYSQKFNHFYVQQPFVQETTQSGTLKVLFANIHKDNADYTGIKKIITDNNPDVLLFVEFADHHYMYLKDFLQKNYPYINHITRSKTFVGNMVFSKYPIDNKADDFAQGMRRYGYFALPYQDQQIYFYLLHTSSPDTENHFFMRNKQLTTFVQDFQKHERIQQHKNIVVVGDLNITPWSSYYPILASAFSGTLVNITQRIPFLFTWKLKELPLFLAHIDHLWTSTSLDVQNMQVLPLPGSDHKAFLFSLDIK